MELIGTLRRAVAAAALLGYAAAQPLQPPAPAFKPGYAGTEACKMCHEEIAGRFAKSPHFTVETNKSRGWAAQACESCHGPGAKHAESAEAKDIRQPAKLSPAETDRTCLSCHLNANSKMGRIMTGHAKDSVACTSCHTVHGTGGKKLVERKAADVNAQCASCHTSVWAAFQKPYKHRLPEGAMSCTNCHNPHASFQPQMMRASFGNEPTCVGCHSDKRGPFLFEHAPVRFEGCNACHEPHGSANPRMLTRHEVRFVCLECHANNPPTPALPPATNPATARVNNLGQTPPAFHDLRNPRFQNCTVCHVKVHGSYVDRTFVR